MDRQTRKRLEKLVRAKVRRTSEETPVRRLGKGDNVRKIGEKR